ncbi:nicotinate-nucleotide pyrophosphorylase [Oleidesulfovibrio alaskensis G20]|jgi:nicotinate-nucleotide pyrophosphorylase (carboxylating)|uniref:nicotinate-nucleotide diphosphorylase (carboxylating) n=2 Tax=Oleidesulfovibrio alaskensis TaxID=58180 RepID=Q310L8_OLEA2|nr:nicotinate-nucleotide pyrophosphorylase [Oleidesulfovibrio alaskensis G20]
MYLNNPMTTSTTHFFFAGEALRHTVAAIDLAITEDGPDLTSNAVFAPSHQLAAQIIAKEDSLVCGLAYIPYIMDRVIACDPQPQGWDDYTVDTPYADGAHVTAGTTVVRLRASARRLLKAERIILNFMTHLSGIANLTARYVDALSGTGTRLLDTRKTLPGLRYPEKYAVVIGGGLNHRRNLQEMLMLKDNHIDLAGSITAAVQRLRDTYSPCPPVEVECRTPDDVCEAVACNVDRIMLDNMDADGLAAALPLIPDHIETEASGGVTLETIRVLAQASSRRLDFISVGRLTHSAPSADFSMRISE